MLGDAEVARPVHASGEPVVHRISETFRSIQGEGLLAGAPSTFIRYAHCNLTCSWCDAAYTWKGDVQHLTFTTADLLLETQGCDHVVITGGEPTIQAELPELLAALRKRGLHITVETNGTVHPDEWDLNWLVRLYSVSPKLGSSGQEEMINADALLGYMARSLNGRNRQANLQLKFVIDSEDDLDAALILLDGLRAAMRPASDYPPVILQPNGLVHTAQVMIDGERQLTDQGERKAGVFANGEPPIVDVELQVPYLDRVRWLYELALDRADDLSAYDVRVMTQAHKFAWGNKRGF